MPVTMTPFRTFGRVRSHVIICRVCGNRHITEYDNFCSKCGVTIIRPKVLYKYQDTLYKCFVDDEQVDDLDFLTEVEYCAEARIERHAPYDPQRCPNRFERDVDYLIEDVLANLTCGEEWKYDRGSIRKSHWSKMRLEKVDEKIQVVD